MEIDLSKCEILEFDGINSMCSKAYVATVDLGLRSYDTSESATYFKAPVLFSENMIDNGFGIVGQIGFFSEFVIKMDYDKELIQLESYKGGET